MMDIWGAGFVDQDLATFDSEVYVRCGRALATMSLVTMSLVTMSLSLVTMSARFEEKAEAAAAWEGLAERYRELTPAIRWGTLHIVCLAAILEVFWKHPLFWWAGVKSCI